MHPPRLAGGDSFASLSSTEAWHACVLIGLVQVPLAPLEGGHFLLAVPSKPITHSRARDVNGHREKLQQRLQGSCIHSGSPCLTVGVWLPASMNTRPRRPAEHP